MPASSIVRGASSWTIKIENTSTENVSIDHLDVYWWNWSQLEKVSFREKIIWGSIEGASSPQTLTFYSGVNPADLIVYAGAAENNSLQFAFLDNLFIIYHVKVYLTNGCYVQLWQ